MNDLCVTDQYVYTFVVRDTIPFTDIAHFLSRARARPSLSTDLFFVFVALQAETNIRLMCVQHVLRDGR